MDREYTASRPAGHGAQGDVEDGAVLPRRRGDSDTTDDTGDTGVTKARSRTQATAGAVEDGAVPPWVTALWRRG